MHGRLAGTALGIAASVALGAAMLPFRAHLSPATAVLVMVLPVIAGSVVGGFVAGMVTMASGLTVVDLLLTEPYGHLEVASAQNAVALAVYVGVTVLVARLVGSLEASRHEAEDREGDARRLLELSDLVVENQSVDALLRSIVETVRTVFSVDGVALLVAQGERLVVAASAGVPPTPADLHRLDPQARVPVSVGTGPDRHDGMRTVALSAAGRPVGVLAVKGLPASERERELLGAFANHAALALERAQLVELALRTEVLEEIDGFRHALMGSVSHDLRTPLATMKVASSTLCDADLILDDADRRELHLLIDGQTDRLARLVSGLLDVNRFEAGALEIRRQPAVMADLVDEALDTLRWSLGDRPVVVELSQDLPKVSVDPVLVGQALVNLVDNADRHAPPGTPIKVVVEPSSDGVTVAVVDAGPGVPPEERHGVFDRFVRFDTGGRAGLGLWIAKTFVEAHGGRIWVEEGRAPGACFRLSLPSADVAVAR